jgi:hypothetical protein
MVNKSVRRNPCGFGTTAGRRPGAAACIWGGKHKLTDYHQAEALKRLAAGESCRAVAKGYRVHHATVSRLQSA